MYNFKNKTVWLIGASSGIGYHLLLRLLDTGAKVIASGRNLAKIEALVPQYSPEQLSIIFCDVTTPLSVIQAKEYIQTKFEYIDTIIINAGASYDAPSQQLCVQNILKNHAVNFNGMLYCLEAGLELLAAAPSPYIVATTSMAALIGMPRAEGYGSAKAAARYMLQCLQSFLIRDNITLTIITPGFVDTPLTKKNKFPMPFLLDAKAASFKILKGMQRQQPEIIFPKRLWWLICTVNLLPKRLKILILSKLPR